MSRSPAPRSAFVLAAGLGTRMGAITDKLPKPLVKVGGRTLLDRAIDVAVGADIERVVVNVHYLADQIREALAARKDVEIAISEEPELLETGGGVMAALPLLGEGPFLVLNSDTVWLGPAPLGPLFWEWESGDAEVVLLLKFRPSLEAQMRWWSLDSGEPMPNGPRGTDGRTDVPGGGDFLLEEDGRVREPVGPSSLPDYGGHLSVFGWKGGRLRRDAEHPDSGIYTGAQILTPEAFAGMPEGAWSFNLLWDRLIARGTARGALLGHGDWMDAGTPAGLATAEQWLMRDGSGEQG